MRRELLFLHTQMSINLPFTPTLTFPLLPQEKETSLKELQTYLTQQVNEGASVRDITVGVQEIAKKNNIQEPQVVSSVSCWRQGRRGQGKDKGKEGRKRRIWL